jgi:hypothetical protein
LACAGHPGGGWPLVTGYDRSYATDAALIAALAAGATQDAAAEIAGVTARTVRRRLENPDFVERLCDERSALVERTCSRLLGLTEQAVTTLADLLADGVGESIRLRAAMGLLDAARTWRDVGEVEERVRTLEAAIALKNRSAA